MKNYAGRTAVRAAGQVFAGRGGLRAQISSPRRALVYILLPLMMMVLERLSVDQIMMLVSSEPVAR